MNKELDLDKAINFHREGLLEKAEKIYLEILNIDKKNSYVLQLIGTVSTVSATESQGSVVLDGTDANSANNGDTLILEDATDPSDIVYGVGLEAPADQSDVLIGSGTKFLTDL